MDIGDPFWVSINIQDTINTYTFIELGLATFYVSFYSNNIQKFQSSQLTTVLESAMCGVPIPAVL